METLKYDGVRAVISTGRIPQFIETAIIVMVKTPHKGTICGTCRDLTKGQGYSVLGVLTRVHRVSAKHREREREREKLAEMQVTWGLQLSVSSLRLPF